MDDTTPNISENPTLYSNFPANHKFYNHFFFKPLLIALIFLVAFQLLSSEVLDIISQYLHTRSWEILQLIFVGIAVSYGLFSKTSSSNDDHDDETENEYYYSSKIENVGQSCASKLFQAPSFFDDEAENHDISDENKFQTWNNQYHSDKPVVVVANESSRIVEKPLLLPIRSLKSPVFEPISDTTSPKPPRNLSSSLPLSSESEAKIDDKFIIKQSFLKSSVSPPPPPPPPPPCPLIRESTQLKSSSIVTDEKGISENELRRSIKSVPMELRNENRYESAYKGKPFRIIRPFIGAARARVLYGKDYTNGKEETFVEKRGYTDKMRHDKYHITSKPTGMEIPNDEKTIQSVEKVIVKTDEDSEIETEDDYLDEISGNVEVPSKAVGDEGPDVDKKADEFIAKFREQIRLQRTASRRKSAGLQPA